MHELITMWQTPMPDKDIEEIRDIYIFSCYTGYAFSDAMSLEEAKCGAEINVNDILYHQLQEEIKKEYNAKLATLLFYCFRKLVLLLMPADHLLLQCRYYTHCISENYFNEY